MTDGLDPLALAADERRATVAAAGLAQRGADR